MPESETNPKTILIVDDEDIIRDFVSAVLSKSYHILVATSGQDALRQSREHEGSIDLLLSNVQMPGMNGLELGTKLNEERPDMRAMLMSGFSSGMLVLNEGWHFLHKPFVPAQLRNLVSSVLAQNLVDTPNLQERRHSANS